MCSAQRLEHWQAKAPFRMIYSNTDYAVDDRFGGKYGRAWQAGLTGAIVRRKLNVDAKLERLHGPPLGRCDRHLTDDGNSRGSAEGGFRALISAARHRRATFVLHFVVRSVASTRASDAVGELTAKPLHYDLQGCIERNRGAVQGRFQSIACETPLDQEKD